MRNILVCLCLIMQLAIASKPEQPDFSINNRELQEPPALPQVYDMVLPDIVSYFSMSHEKQDINAFLPYYPVIMEICAITEPPQYYYATREELLNGCYRGDIGLSLFELQPYQYWNVVSELKEIYLTPKIDSLDNIIRILINYKNVNSAQNITTIEIGDNNYPDTSIIINGQKFYNHDAVVSAFYGLVTKIKNDAYPRETRLGY